jgi:hypothetical protein
MATVATQLNAGSGFASGEVVTPTKLNNLVNTATVTNIVNADVSATAAIAGSKITPNFGSQNVVTTGAGGFGTATPDAKAALDVTSTTQGFLPPRMTTAQRDAITSPTAGLVLYNSSTNKLQVRTNTAWTDLH